MAEITTVNNRYILEDKLGEGGMGAVWKAVDRLTGKTVALKQVLTDASISSEDTSSTLAGDTLSVRLALAQEFKVLASLRHPHIINVLDYGFDSDQQPYFTMEYLEDTTSILEVGLARSVIGKTDLINQVLQALAYLHRRGVIHRDLKPGNIMVQDDEVRVLDFGLAVGVDRSEEQMSIAGTLAYMAPEVLRGESPAAAADLYAMGVIIYEMLAGKLPFTPDSRQFMMDVLTALPDISFIEAIEEDLDAATDPASQTIYDAATEAVVDVDYGDEVLDSLEEMLANMSSSSSASGKPTLARVVERLLSKSPELRYANADEVIRDISIAVHQPVPVESAAIRESFLQSARFVGRDDDMAQLIRAMAGSRSSEGTAWIIGGESGVGKSRMLDELRIRALVDGMSAMRGQGVADGGLPYQLWREPLRNLLLMNDISDLDAGILKDIVHDIDDLLGRPIPHAPPIEGEAYQERLVATIMAVFKQQKHPTVLMLEDLQWTRESLDVLKRLTAIVHELPFVIVGTYRSDEMPDLPADLPNMQQIQLERLDAEAVAQLSESMLGNVGRRDDLVELLHKETEGNVYFLVEAVRALAEEAGSMEQIAHSSLPQRIIAGGIDEVMSRRLSRMPAESLDILRLAAVIGRELDIDLLNHLTSEADVITWLTTASNVGVIEINEGAWSFAHAQLRQVALNQIPDAERATLHRRVAEAIESLYGNQPERAVVLVQHWHEAGDTAKEYEYSAKAGRYLLHISNLGDAVVSLENAIKLLDDVLSEDEQLTQRSQLLLQLGKALHYLGSYEEAARYLDEALELRQQLGNEADIAEALLELGDLRRQMGDNDQAREMTDSSLEKYQAIDHQSGIARALDRSAIIHFKQGDYPTAVELGTQALEMGRSIHEMGIIASALNNLGLTSFAQGDYAAAEKYFNEAEQLCRTTGERRRTGVCLLNLGSAAGQQGNYERAATYLEGCLEIARSIGEQRMIAFALDNLGEIARLQGNYDHARDRFEQSLVVAQTIGNKQRVVNTLINLGHLDSQQSQYDSARYLYKQAIEQAYEIEAIPKVLEALGGLAGVIDDAERAARLIGLVEHHPATYNATKERLAEKREALSEALSEEEIEQFVEAGGSDDLEQTVKEFLEADDFDF
jgi:serine/threonine protein kinase/tetratricopeptide (TPR) repeat protein